MEPLRVLKETFGHSAFRPGQEEIVNALLSGRDVLAIMPTGTGKSVCYQLPALLLEGITIVVSPLISLMKDQVAALCQCGVPAAYLNSSLTPAQQNEALRRAAIGRYKLIYVAPERLLTERFLQFVGSVRIAMIIVDEAHCISQWGQDFRPRYLDIPVLVDALSPRPPVGAFTATATAQVQRDIVSLLQLKDPCRVLSSLNRKNLYFGVERPKSNREREEALIAFLTRHRGESGIIYCISRNGTQELAAFLRSHGFSAAAYHAGLTSEERTAAQEDFLYDRVQIMVATNAFGMGIDKSNVSFVVHYQLPGDLESYYQEAGRAGRDGSPAECILYYRPSDLRIHRFMIDQLGSENDQLSEEERETLRHRSRRRLYRMMDYCSAEGCLRRNLLSYFGEVLEEDCGYCSHCLRGYELEDSTIPAQKYLSCVLRLRRLGLPAEQSLVEDVLLGIPPKRPEAAAAAELSTFGLLKGTAEEELRLLRTALLSRGLLAEREDGTFAVTERAREVLRGERVVTLRRPAKQPPEKQSPDGKEPLPPVPEPVDEALFERLKEVRLRLARRQGVPAYVVCSDAALREICRLRPRTPEALLGVNGFGRARVERYGAALMEALTRYEASEKRNAGAQTEEE